MMHEIWDKIGKLRYIITVILVDVLVDINNGIKIIEDTINIY